jgi:hypothetical protein
MTTALDSLEAARDAIGQSDFAACETDLRAALTRLHPSSKCKTLIERAIALVEARDLAAARTAVTVAFTMHGRERLPEMPA